MNCAQIENQIIEAVANLQSPSIVWCPPAVFEREKLSQMLSTKGFFVVYVDEQNLTYQHELFRALDKACNFPEYFGFNWSALKDCLLDFHWLTHPVQGYVIVLENIHSLDEVTLTTFQALIADVSTLWAKENKPFKLLLFRNRE